MKEVWKEIEGYEGLYQVSNLGRVKSLERQCGTVYKKEKVLSADRLTKDGYVKVALRKDNVATEFRVHQLVARSFIPNTDNKETVNHIDGDKRNNKEENLEWATRSEQLDHAYKNGLKKPVSWVNTKLTEEDVREIRNTYKRQSKEYGTVALAKKYGVSNVVIGLIVRGKTYKYVI